MGVINGSGSRVSCRVVRGGCWVVQDRAGKVS